LTGPPVISRYIVSEQLLFQFNYDHPRRIGNFAVQNAMDFGVFNVSRQIVSEQQLQTPPERWKQKLH